MLRLAFLLFVVLFPSLALGADKADKKDKDSEAEGSEAEVMLKGEVLCEADVFYTWKHIDKSAMSSNPMAAADSAAMMRSEPADSSKVEKVFFSRFGEKGKSEEQARNRLLSLLPRVEREARTHCEHKHQDQALCMARQLRASDYQRVDFTVRQALLPAITESCQQLGGTCLETKVGTVACYVLSPPEAAETAKSEDGKKAK